MRNEVRVGRVRGSGAVMNLTAAAQIITGLACTLEIPKGCVALVTLNAWANVNNSFASFSLDVDGTAAGPPVTPSNPGAAQVVGAMSWVVSSGRRALRPLVSSGGAVGTVDPANCSLSWVIAPQGGLVS